MDIDNEMDFELKYLQEKSGFQIGDVVYLKSDLKCKCPMSATGYLELSGEPIKVCCEWLDKYNIPRRESYAAGALTREREPEQSDNTPDLLT